MKKFLILLLVCGLVQAQPVYIYTGYWPTPISKVEYAAWDWNQHVGTSFYYAGTSSRGFNPGSITIRVGSIAEWANLPVDGLASADFNGCEIVISPYLFLLNNIQQRLVTHEFGHCVGALHSANAVDLMFPTAGKNDITQQDVKLSIASPYWTLGTISYCHSTVDADWTLYIPQIGGVSAKSIYTGDHKLNHTWAAPTITPNTLVYCAGNALQANGNVFLGDVRVYGVGSFSAVLEPSGASWRLVSASPH